MKGLCGDGVTTFSDFYLNFYFLFVFKKVSGKRFTLFTTLLVDTKMLHRIVTKGSQLVTVPNMVLTPPPLFKGERLWRMVLSPSRRQISAEHKQPTVKDNAAARCKASLTVGCGSAMRNPATGNQQSSERICYFLLFLKKINVRNIAAPTLITELIIL